MKQFWAKIREFASTRLRSVGLGPLSASWDPPRENAEKPAVNAPPSTQSDPATPPDDDVEWEDAFDEILCEIAEAGANGLSIRQVRNRLELSAIRGEHYLDSLENMGLVDRFDERFVLSADGRAYLVQADLVE